MTEFIKKLREKSEVYSCVKLSRAEYYRGGRTLCVKLISSRGLNAADEKIIAELIKAELPFASVLVSVQKSLCDADIAKKAVYDFICAKYPSVRGSVLLSDIKASVQNSAGEALNGKSSISVEICAESEACKHLQSEGLFSSLESYLDKNFCENFSFKFSPRADAEDGDVLKAPVVDVARIEAIPLRKFKVADVTRLFDNFSEDEVVYIEDAAALTGDVVVAGRVSSLRERETKTGKPFYIIELDDGTGKMSGTIFSTKEIIRKMEKVQEGSEVIAAGKCEYANGYHRFTIKSLNFCSLPKNFVYEERAARRPPETYLTVAPSEIEEIRQTDMFTDQAVPEALKGTSIVVVDLETTGTSASEDKVTEIGAVKIENGKITCKLATMVNPERRIPPEVVELTGITDAMVASAPKFEEVAGDLYKFCHGSIIVAHNLPFDYGFIKNLSKPFGYVYTNRGMDTLDLSRALLKGLANYKLNTVCAHFGIEFLHHRAYSDALATAQLFIELIKIKGSL